MIQITTCTKSFSIVIVWVMARMIGVLLLSIGDSSSIVTRTASGFLYGLPPTRSSICRICVCSTVFW